MFKIDNEKDLINVLKIFAEESVSKAKKTLNESIDNAQEKYIQGLTRDEGIYNVNLSEQENEEEQDETDSTQDEEETEDAEKEVENKEVDPEEFGVSFDSVLKDINNLRAGRSTKDKEIKDELLGYYDKLDESERKVLHLFLRALSKILQGAVSASDAIDPSDEPFNFDIIAPEDKHEKQKNAQSTEDDSQNTEKLRNRNTAEDNTPPIRVNESQNLNEIRNKIKKLMKRI